MKQLCATSGASMLHPTAQVGLAMVHTRDQLLPSILRAKHKNPQFSPHGLSNIAASPGSSLDIKHFSEYWNRSYDIMVVESSCTHVISHVSN